MWSNINVTNKGRDEEKWRLRYEIRREKGKSEKWRERRGKTKAKLKKKWEIKQEKLQIIITMIIARSSTKVLHSILQICSLPHFPTRTKPHHFTTIDLASKGTSICKTLIGRFQFPVSVQEWPAPRYNRDSGQRPLKWRHWSASACLQAAIFILESRLFYPASISAESSKKGLRPQDFKICHFVSQTRPLLNRSVTFYWSVLVISSTRRIDFFLHGTLAQYSSGLFRLEYALIASRSRIQLVSSSGTFNYYYCCFYILPSTKRLS